MKLTKADVAVSNLVAGIEQVVNAWQPGEFANELKYRDSLLAFIRDAIPADCSVEKEYRHHGTTMDLYVKWSGLLLSGELFIEVKRNLDKKATLDRLVGQVETLGPGKHAIMVVLVGNTDPALLRRLQDRYKHLSDPDSENQLAIVVKRAPVASVDSRV